VDQAIDAALGIQRRLEDQRRENGFAPQVRIGVHRSEARRTGLDYIGGGVNLAARIGKGRSGFRGAGERRDAGVVEASRRARRPSVGPAERLPEPVDVASVGWR
jgi:hypothetical protein